MSNAIPGINDANPEILAKDTLEMMMIWGMSRQQAKRICAAMNRKVNDDTFPWRDLTNTNVEETRNMLEQAGAVTDIKKKGGIFLS